MGAAKQKMPASSLYVVCFYSQDIWKWQNHRNQTQTGGGQGWATSKGRGVRRGVVTEAVWQPCAGGPPCMAHCA